MRLINIASAITVLAVAAAGPAIAARGGNGNGGNATGSSGSCSVSDNAVTATGLPTNEVINFLVSDATGTGGWVLGFTGDGTWSEAVAPPNGATVYSFVSRTWGPEGSKYTVYASCSS